MKNMLIFALKQAKRKAVLLRIHISYKSYRSYKKNTLHMEKNQKNNAKIFFLKVGMCISKFL